MARHYKRIAIERIRRLFNLAAGSKNKSKRYVVLAEKVGMKARVKIPKDLKMKYCKGCKVLFNSKTLKVRIKNKEVIYECLKCGYKKRYPFIKEKKKTHSK